MEDNLYTQIKEAIAHGGFTAQDCCQCDNDEVDDYITELYQDAWDQANSTQTPKFCGEVSAQAGMGQVTIFIDDQSVQGTVSWDFQQEGKVLFSFFKEASTREQFISLLKNWFLEKMSNFTQGRDIRLDV